MPEEIKNYELTVLLKSEQDYSELIEIIKNSQFQINSESQLLRTKLAYPIKKENFAYFGNLYFSGSSQDVKKLSEALKSNLKILRFFIFIKPAPQGDRSEKPKRSPRRLAESIDMSETISRITTPTKSGTLSNEALEKTLEEILK